MVNIMLKLQSTIQSFSSRITTTVYKTCRNTLFDKQELRSYEYNFFKDDAEDFKADFLLSVIPAELGSMVLGIILKIDRLTKESNHSLDITKEVYKLWMVYHDVENGIKTINQVINTIVNSDVSMELNSEAFSMIHELLPGVISIPRLIGESSDKDEFSYSFNRSSWKMDSVSKHGKHVESLLNEVPMMLQFIEVENGKGDDETLYSNTILNGAVVLLGDIYKTLPCDDREHLRVYFNMLVGGNILTNGFTSKSTNIKSTKEQFVINGAVAYDKYDDSDQFEVFTALPTVGFAVSGWSVKSNPVNPRYTSLMTWVNPEGNFRYLKINKYSEGM